jgi:hypothetical protein
MAVFAPLSEFDLAISAYWSALFCSITADVSSPVR